MVLPHKDFYLLLVVLRPNYHIVVSSLQKQDLGEKRRAVAWCREWLFGSYLPLKPTEIASLTQRSHSLGSTWNIP